MRLSELVDEIRRAKPEFSRGEIERGVRIICGEIADALAAGGRVEIRGFGVFHLSRRRARLLRSPRSGEAVHIGDRSVPRFTAGKRLRRAIDEGGGRP